MERFRGWIVRDDGSRPAAAVEIEDEMMTVLDLAAQSRTVGRVVRIDPDPGGSRTLLIRLTGKDQPIAFLPEDAGRFLHAVTLQNRQPLIPEDRDPDLAPLPPSPAVAPASPIDMAKYRSPLLVARITQSLLLLFIVGGGYGLAAAVADYRTIDAFIQDPLSLNIQDAFLNADHSIFRAMVLATLIVGISFVVWTRRVYRNSEILGARPLRYRKGWAIWGWLVPFANYVIPLHILLDVWRGSDPEAGPQLPPGWNRVRVPRMLTVWWAVWVAVPLSSFLGALGYSSDPTSLDPYRAAAAAGVVSAVLWLASAVLALFAVQSISSRQQARAEAVARASFPSPPTDSYLPAKPIAVPSAGLPRLRRLTAGAILGSVVVAVVGFVALDPDVLDGPGAAVRSGEGEIVSSGSILLADLGVGDCFDLPDQLSEPGFDAGEPIFGVLVVPCADPHDAEVYAIVDLEGARSSPYPGLAVIDDQSATRCFNRFWNYVGAHLHDSRLDLTWFYPQETGWDLGDRTVVCAAYDPSTASLTASIKDSGGITDGTALPWALDLGDCFDVDDETFLLKMTDCAKPHDYEVFAVVDAPADGDDFPGTFPLTDFGVEHCLQQFVEFVGVPVEQAGLEQFPITPDAYAWQLKDRQIRCVLNSLNLARLTGSMEGKGVEAGTAEG